MKKLLLLLLLFSSILSAQTPGSGVTDIDGNTYSTVIIGSQEWMAENLKVTRYSNGDAISNETDPSSWIASTASLWCYYNNDSSLNASYGKMYNGYVAKDSRNVCPDGWIVPVEQDYIDLIDYLGGEAVAGGKLKESGTSNWANGNTGTNSSGFNGLPGGIVSVNTSTWNAFSVGGSFWTSDERNVQNQGMFTLYLFFDLDSAQLNFSATNMGMSIRCMKDAASGLNELRGMELNPIYPNPSSGIVNIDLQQHADAILRVVNPQGQLLLEKSVNASPVFQLDLSDWENGMYIIEVLAEKQKYYYKVLKQ